MKPYFETETGKLYCGDVVDVLQKLPEKSVNMCITSPPYWALRDYGVKGQLGLEPTFEEYIDKLCNIFDGVKRVLRDDGTCWVNIGDTYGANYRGSGVSNASDMQKGNRGTVDFMGEKPPDKGNIKDKSLVMIPFRFAIKMVNRGWILRNTIIWHKPNCMPSSVKDRFTVDFEYIFFFSKKKKYYFEQQFEDAKAPGSVHIAKKGDKSSKIKNTVNPTYFDRNYTSGKTRNKRSVWKITTKPFSKAHFAVYPEELIKTPIKAGCPKEVCKECGKPKKRVIEEKRVLPDNYKEQRRSHKEAIESTGGLGEQAVPKYDIKRKTKGYKPTCDCNAGFEAGIVLDIFMGSGTTGLVAEKLNRKWIGIDLNEEYCEIAKQRIKQEADQEKLF